MKMKIIILVMFLVLMISCGDKHTTNLTPISSSSQEISSSSLENRLDIAYDDSLTLEELNELELAPRLAPYLFYLGKLPEGSEIALTAKTNVENLIVLNVMSESADKLLPRYSVVDLVKGDTNVYDTLYRDYMIAGLDTATQNNVFFTTNENWFYVEIMVDSLSEDTVSLDLTVKATPAKYKFIKDSLNVETDKKEVLAFGIMGGGNQNYYLCFDVEKGKATDLKSEGSPIDSSFVRNSSNEIVEGIRVKDKIGTRLTPNEDEKYCAQHRSSHANYLSGNYVLLSVTVDNVDLPQGEYFSTADSIEAGETLTFTRPENALAQYNVEYYHYMYLGEYTSGTFLKIWYGAYGLDENKKNLVIMKENENDSNLIEAFSVFEDENFALSNGNDFKVEVDAKYYLRFISREGYFSSEEKAIEIKTLLENLGEAKDIELVKDVYNIPKDSIIKLEDVRVSDLQLAVTWSIPFVDTLVLGYDSDTTSVVDDSLIVLGEEERITTSWIKAMNEGEAKLIATSVVDSSFKDTCIVTVTQD